ncbi:hypothetical protein TEQG_03937 [Trichophyton equinum CBS 127.97]|uniref:DUF7730 domain-containing protein n=1 Tax=Trichophyton equinum (strain ATCC MYA-4606 / CBS 127.97) TaxID=559882 RepID=F2PSI5_TRIEC|nr:hypothetical protein TEQG_03937 [Trichophyton equinum CBS 127.97]
MARDCRYTLIDICQIICCIVCLPVLIPVYYIYTSVAFREYQWARRFKQYHKTDVLPLPARRQRSLSINAALDSPQQQQSQTLHTNEREPGQPSYGQAQSRLFQLPAELRLMIYNYVVGSQKIHIVHTNSRQLAAFPCTQDPETVASDGNVCNCVSENVVHTNKQTGCTFVEDILAPVTCERPGIGILSLLQSCRLMYTEAIEVLYARRTFSFEQPYTFLAFAHSILPQRLNAITSIEIAPWDWSVFYDDGRSQFYRKAQRFWPRTRNGKEPMPNTWEVTCYAIANEMESIREFRLRIYSQKIRCRRRISYSSPHSNLQAVTEIICRPLYQVGKLERFEVELCWPVKWEMPENTPFKIIAPSSGKPYADY